MEVAKVLRLAAPCGGCVVLTTNTHLPPHLDSVDLMDTNGRLMNLQEKQDSVESAGSLLEERRHYVLLRLRRESTNGKHALCFYCERASKYSCVLQGETKQQQHCSAFLCWTVRPPTTRSLQVKATPPDAEMAALSRSVYTSRHDTIGHVAN